MRKRLNTFVCRICGNKFREVMRSLRSRRCPRCNNKNTPKRSDWL